ncbi:MAG TPA: hypothetical protein DGG94_20845 [Micromonosporaceae bacterium]|nr:hypothetical protein [Micromonosporaceae bacterium]HCU52210.1 hypothetical protein [Micromonosporaceae bacterium]
MASSTEFVEFVNARSHRLLRAAYLLTRDHALAEDLLQTALARSWPVWHRIDGDPEPYVRRILVNTHNSWWRRRWNFERPTAAPPDHGATVPHAEVDDRDEVWRALDKLPKQQRAVLVLRYFEDMSEAQIAETLSISAGSVKNYAAKGLAKLRLDPTFADADRLNGVYDRIQVRRRKIITVGAAVVVATILLIGYLLSPLLHRKALPPTEDPGFPEYFHGYRVVLQHEQPNEEMLPPMMWIPSTLDGALLVKCTSYGRKAHIQVGLSVNGTNVVSANCASQTNLDEPLIAPVDPADMRAAGVNVGARVIYHLAVGAPSQLTPRSESPADSGVAAIAFGEAVPYERFPMPERPARVPQLERDLSGDFANPAVIIEAGGSHTASLAWEGRFLRLYVNSQTPGTLRITLNGLLLDSVTWWDYRQSAYRSMPALPTGFVEPPVGVPVMITVEAQHTSGDWFVAVA